METRQITRQNGQPSRRSPKRWAARLRRHEEWVRQAERDTSKRSGPTTEDKTRIKELEGEVHELRRTTKSFARRRFFCAGGARPPTEVMVSLINQHRQEYGVESMCSVLPIAPSTYYEQARRQREPGLLSREKRVQFAFLHAEKAFSRSWRCAEIWR